MNNLKMKKSHVLKLLKSLQNLEKDHSSFFQKRTVLELCEVKTTSDGFTVLFPNNIPDEILEEINKLINIYTIPD